MLNLNNLNSLKLLERGSGGKGFLAKNLTFSAPLISSVTAFGKGSTTPTFTRATTATITDHEGFVRNVLSGEPRFYGARRIRNQFTFSQDFTNAIWTKNALTSSTFTGFADPFNGTTGASIVVDNGSSVIGNDGVGSLSQTFTKTASVAQLLMFTIYAKANTAYVLRVREATTSGFRAVFNLVTGEVTYENSATAANYNAQMQSVGNGWYRCSIRYTTGTGASQQFNIKGSGAGTSTTGDGVSNLYIACAQVEDITGKNIQAPSEYVSTNVLSGAYHGAMVDGVKYVNNEVQVEQNFCRYSDDLTNAWTPTDLTVTAGGDTTPLGYPAYAITDNAVNSSHRLAMSSDTYINGLSYTATAYIKAGTKDTAVFRLVDGPFTQGGRMHISSIANMSYTEVLTGTATMTSSMVDAGNGWRKITATVTFPSAVSLPMYVLFYTGADTNTYVGTGQYFLAGSVQVRQNAPQVTSTYVPTTIRALQNVNGIYTLPTTTTLGYLSELAVTNLLQRSEEMDNASWLKTDVTVTANNVPSPDGYTTADLCTEGVAGTASLNQGSGAYTANTPVTFSVYLKRGNTDWVRVTQTGTATPADSVRAWFNLATGAKGSVQAAGAATQASSTIQAMNNGWYRCSVTYLPNATETTTQTYISSASADNVPTRVNNATYYAWGAQCEIGLGATSYIPTTSTTASRNSENLNYPATGNIEASTGTVNAEHTLLVSTVPSSGRIIGYLGSSSASPMTLGSSNLFQSADGTNFPAVAVAMVVGTTYKLGIAFGGSTQSLARGNPSAGTSLDVAFDGAYGATLSSINIGNIGTNQPNGCIRNVKVYKVKVTNTTLTSLVA
jgi:hypothetical protein